MRNIFLFTFLLYSELFISPGPRGQKTSGQNRQLSEPTTGKKGQLVRKKATSGQKIFNCEKAILNCEKSDKWSENNEKWSEYKKSQIVQTIRTLNTKCCHRVKVR